MIKTYSYPSPKAASRIRAISNRRAVFPKSKVQQVNRIVEDVRKRGDAALIEYGRQFDSPAVDASNLRATAQEFDDARKSVQRSFVRALNRAIRQIEDFHRQQHPTSWFTSPRPGAFLGQMIRPVGAAGIYVPGSTGGKTPLVSSVLMGAIPAKIAGVSRVVMVSPPRKDGSLDPHLLVAARKVGVDTVYKVGSAWAIAALAHGTETVAGVDVIVGPGNVYVTLAKKMVAGMVGIDMIAGPSEILVIADENADPVCVAADLLSQAEHDTMASAVLVTPSKGLARAVSAALQEQLEHLPRKSIAAASLTRFGAILVVPDLEAAIALSNQIAPEHLELLIDRPFDHVGEIVNAGAVFMGNHTPEPVGDYIAGPNHVLPTAGTARFSSALGVENFIKKTSLIHYSPTAFAREAADVIRLAKTEGLEAHARAMEVRLARQKSTSGSKQKI